MPELQLFEYAVIRLVPRVEREEFINVGVVLYCRGQKYLQSMFLLDEGRLLSLFPEVDLEGVRSYLAAFDRICAGGKGAGPIGQLPVAERFRWLTATRSTVLQSSKVHPGRCPDPQAALVRLFEQQVV